MSLTWTAVYLRGAVPPAFKLPVDGVLAQRSLGPWTELALPGVQDPTPLARALSKRVPGEVVAVQVQSTACVFLVLHCEAGAEVRRLEFSDTTWRRVEGQRREWEVTLYAEARLEAALASCDDAGQVRAAFARADVQPGDSFPRPELLGAMCSALGVTEAQWSATRNSPPVATLKGARTSKLSVGARASFIAALTALAASAFTTGDTRVLLVSFGLPMTMVAAGTAFLRRLLVGRWLL